MEITDRQLTEFSQDDQTCVTSLPMETCPETISGPSAPRLFPPERGVSLPLLPRRIPVQELYIITHSVYRVFRVWLFSEHQLLKSVAASRSMLDWEQGNRQGRLLVSSVPFQMTDGP